jgi:acyl transferase domain-containing protein/acyl carrier protein
MSDFLERISKLSPKRLALLAAELQAKLDALERTRTEPIAIIGMGCRFPGAADPAAFWALLDAGVDAITEVPRDRWDVDAWYDPDPDAAGKMSTRFGGFLVQVDRFDAAFFGIAPRETASMDPQQRLLLEVSWEALEDAGQAPDRLTGTRTGVFVGVCNSDYYQLVMDGDASSLDAYVASGGSHSVAAGRLSYVLGLQGPSVAVDTACSSSLVAVHLACQSLRAGESRMALAGGVNLVIRPDVTMLLSRARMMAPDGRCKAFDARADGFVRGEGCGVVVLKRLGDAQADGDRVLAVIRGTAVNQDGRSNGLTAPNGPAQEAVIREALVAAGVKPADVGYVEAHGTGTSLGDPIEVQALGAVLGEARPESDAIVVGSVKTNIGHLEAAAGVAGLIKVVLAMQHDRVPPHLHFQTPNPHIPWSSLPVRIPVAPTPFPVRNGRRVAGVSSFGFSGTNAHAVLEAAPDTTTTPVERDRPLHLFALSARSEDALRGVAARLVAQLERDSGGSVADLCFSVAAGRAQLTDRAAMVVRSLDEVHAGLSALGRGEAPPAVVRGHADHAPPAPVFLFTGQGAQYARMGRELYETQPTFRATLDRCDALLRAPLGVSLLSVLYPGPGDTAGLIDQTAYTQPALFALEYALSELWRSWGIVPAAVMGHSVGEYVAACVAGALSLEDGLALVAERGRLMQALPAGQMVAVFAPEQRVRGTLGVEAAQVSIAAVNGPEHVVLSGAPASLAAVVGRLTAAGLSSRALTVSHAFHSPMMEPILSAFEARAAAARIGRPRIRLVSNLTGRPVSGDELATPTYWSRHLREPVRFAEGMRALHELGHSVFVEIGPAPTLLSMGARCVPEGAVTWLPSLRRGRGDWASLLESLATLFALGAHVDWKGLDRDYPRRRLSVPTYPFQRIRHWVATSGPGDRRRRPPLPAGGAVDNGAETLPDQLDRRLYDIAWVPRPRESAATWLPALDQLVCRLTASAQHLRHEHGLDGYGALLPELDRLCATYMARGLDGSRTTLRLFQRVSVDTLSAQIGVLERHRRLLGRMLEVLEEDGVLRAEGSGWTVRAPLPTADPDAPALAARFPAWRAQIDMSARCGARLGDVLRGDCDPLQLLFPDGSLEDAERLYTQSPFARAYNALVADTIAEAARAVPPGRTLRVLEIGAGTGGTTAAVLARLPTNAADYVFTDVSPVFTSRAADKFRDYPFLKTAVLDIEQDPSAQGLAGQRFDVVLAANVLHATADLRRTLRHVRQLLAPEGMLVLLEATTPQRFGDLTVGLTEGWWRFTDTDLRSSYALLSRERWALLLREEGFTDVGLVPGADGDPGVLVHQALILARAPKSERSQAGDRSRFIVLCDEGGVGEELGALLESSGAECELVHAGVGPTGTNGARRVVDPTQPEALEQLVANLSATGTVRGVVHLWGLDAPAASAGPDEPSLAHVVGGALHAVQALTTGRSDLDGVPRLWLVTRGAQPAGTPRRLAVGQAPLWGLGSVIALEHPELRCTRIDLDPLEDAAEAAAKLHAELGADDREDQVALRDDARYVARLRRASLATAGPPDGLRIRAGGAYLITGGLGGLGLRSARWLVEQGARHLVLVGRRAPSPVALEAIAELERRGARVTVEQADVARRQDVERVLARAAAELPPLCGVFHAAGVLDDGVLTQQRWERFATVLAPKVLGAINLATLTDGLDLDLFVLFSSGASMLGSAGQGNHAAANAFLDALAHDRRARGAPAVSINWGPWAEIGAAASAELGVRMVSHGMGLMSPDEGIQALDAILRRSPVQIGVLPIDWSIFLGQFGVGKEPPVLAAFRREGVGRGEHASPSEQEPELRARLADTIPSQREGLLVTHVVDRVARVLRLADAEAIDLDQPLVELGIDSLMALELRNTLARAAGCPLPATLLFDCPTPRALTRLLADKLLGATDTAAGDRRADPQSLPPIDECSEEELALLLSQKLDTLNGGLTR